MKKLVAPFLALMLLSGFISGGSTDSIDPLENRIDSSGKERWINNLVLEDLSKEQAAYIAGVPKDTVTSIEGSITLKNAVKEIRKDAADNGFFEESLNEAKRLDRELPLEEVEQLESHLDNGGSFNPGFYQSPQTAYILPGDTPNFEKVTEKMAEEYEGHEMEDDCYRDTYYRPLEFEEPAPQPLLQDIATRSSGEESYSCPDFTSEESTKEIIPPSLENPQLYCMPETKEEDCRSKVRSICEEDPGPVCSAIFANGPGADAVLWQSYCHQNYDNLPIGLSREEKIKCIGESYNKTVDANAPKSNERTNGEIIESFCESTPLVSYNAQNNMCEVGGK